ncbi:MAG TPA: AtpZ/AtpI family protein [Planctomycetaceae bacterium]|nr:AtpZ/AtpI family protein [Planctomycetaceae bacterium]
MAKQSPFHDISGLTAAMRWVQVVTTVALEMALPPGLGYWLDQQWGSSPWLVCVGAILGFATGMRHLIQLVDSRRAPRDHTKNDKKP